MKISCGTDIIEISRIKESIEKLKFLHFINDDEYYILNKRFEECKDLHLKLNIIV